MKMNKIIALALALALTLSLSAAFAATAETSAPPETQEPRTLSEAGYKIALADRAFGFNLFKKLYKDGENLVFSPQSLSTALTMVMEGASGNTRTEMAKALSLSKLTGEDISAGNLNLLEVLSSSEMKIANGLFIGRDAVIEAAFTGNAAANYKAAVQNVDFASPKAAETINAWVKEHTGGMIEKLSDSYDPDTAMSVINAIAFDAKWQDQFDPNNTYDAAFHGSAGEKAVQMMSKLGMVKYASTSAYQAALLPYESGKYQMLIVLPKQGKKLKTVANSLMSEKAFSRLVSGMKDTRVQLGLPRFDIASELPLNDTLKSMGIKLAFDSGNADFSAMSARPLFISSVLQKARIEVAEEGTKAAAATEVIIMPASAWDDQPVSMTCERPFFFAILESASNACPFMGVVSDF